MNHRIYQIEHNTDPQLIGSYPQIEEAIYDCSPLEDPYFIDNVGYKKINFEPKKPVGILTAKAKLTDLLSSPVMGFSNKLLISDILKEILLRSSSTYFQLFNCKIRLNDFIEKEYWILNPISFKLQNVDFKKSEIYLMKGALKKIQELKIHSMEDFFLELNRINQLDSSYRLRFSKLSFIGNEDDFFILNNIKGGVGYFVSEKLKLELEARNVTGISFKRI